MPSLGPLRSGIHIALAVSALLWGCRKDQHDDHASRSTAKSTQSDEQEANRTEATLQSIQLQEKEFRSRLEKAKAGVAKLGNKTRKKLKPDLASLDGKSVRLDSLIRALPSLSAREFDSSVAEIKATLDSANSKLAQVQKFLK